MQKEYYSVNEVAARLGYKPITIYRNVWFGELEAYKIGKEYRIAQSQIDRFLSAHKFDSPYK